MLKSNVHFPTDLNLLWDSSRKCIQLLKKLCESQGQSGWRKNKYWEKVIKVQMRECWQINRGGGKNKFDRVKESITNYINKCYELEEKVEKSIQKLKKCPLSPLEMAELISIEYFQTMLIKHIDLVQRRLIKEEKIPHEEKVFSLFEPHTEWINKGKTNPSVEIGHKLLVTTDQFNLILHCKVMDQTVDQKETLPLACDLFRIYGENTFKSISFDKGFSCEDDRELLELYIPQVIMPKKGRLTLLDKEREHTKQFKLLRNRHSGIESNINALEQTGLNRCPDKGLNGFKRYAALGVLAYNCHRIGDQIIFLKKKKRLKKAA